MKFKLRRTGKIRNKKKAVKRIKRRSFTKYLKRSSLSLNKKINKLTKRLKPEIK
jgi:hypothetical protein